MGYHSSTSQPLEPEEQAAIVQVIQRAEQLDLTEQERVRSGLLTHTLLFCKPPNPTGGPFSGTIGKYASERVGPQLVAVSVVRGHVRHAGGPEGVLY